MIEKADKFPNLEVIYLRNYSINIDGNIITSVQEGDL